jgi:hypothetical protein
MMESIGVRWIGKAKSDVELPVGVAASTTTVLDTALPVESKHLVGLGSEASGGEEQSIPADGALVWLVFTSLTDFLTPAFSDAGIVGAEIDQHPDSDGDHYAK